MSQEISLCVASFTAAIDTLEATRRNMIIDQQCPPTLEGSSVAQESFKGQAERLIAIFQMYKQVLVQDIYSYREILATFEEADGCAARGLSERLEQQLAPEGRWIP